MTSPRTVPRSWRAALTKSIFWPVSGGEVQFRRPLGRSAVYRAASPQDSTSAISRRSSATTSAPSCRSCCAVVLRPYEGTHRDASIEQQHGHPAARRPRRRSPAQARSPERYPASSASGPSSLSFAKLTLVKIKYTVAFMKRYGQACTIARALDVVGERWSLLLVRELILGPRRYRDLATGLPGSPSNVLAARLKHLHAAGVIPRRTLPPPTP